MGQGWTSLLTVTAGEIGYNNISLKFALQGHSCCSISLWFLMRTHSFFKNGIANDCLHYQQKERQVVLLFVNFVTIAFIVIWKLKKKRCNQKILIVVQKGHEISRTIEPDNAIIVSHAYKW